VNYSDIALTQTPIREADLSTRTFSTSANAQGGRLSALKVAWGPVGIICDLITPWMHWT